MQTKTARKTRTRRDPRPAVGKLSWCPRFSFTGAERVTALGCHRGAFFGDILHQALYPSLAKQDFGGTCRRFVPILLGGQKHFWLLPSCLHILQIPTGLSTTALAVHFIVDKTCRDLLLLRQQPCEGFKRDSLKKPPGLCNPTIP